MDDPLTGQWIELVVNLAIPLFLIGLGFAAGRISERKHLRSLDRREAELRGIRVSALRRFLPAADPAVAPRLVAGEAAIGSDYFKTFAAGLRRIVGGEVRSFRTLLDRARREATVRMLAQARAAGCDAVCCVRIDTADIGGGSKSGEGIPMAVVVVSGTAYRCRQIQSPPSPVEDPWSRV